MENRDEFKALIELMRRTPVVQPPEDFTQRTMKKAMEMRMSIFARVWAYLCRPVQFTLNPLQALRNNITRDELFLYFMLISFAHAILAITLLIGFKTGLGVFLPPLFQFQPWISLALAGWLAAWGFVLRGNELKAVKFVKFAILCYIEVVVVNSALLCIEFKHTVAVIPFVAAVLSMNLAAGIFIAAALQHQGFQNNRKTSLR